MNDDEEMPPLPPEIKINMKLDDIIKYEKTRAGVSHVMGPRTRKRNYFRRRYKSQNWRLRGNGPNTPRQRFLWRSYIHRERIGKVRAFLEAKYRTAPMNSVFHRLGWTPTQSAAVNKLWYARNYQRPQHYFPYRRNFHQRQPVDSEEMKKKIIASTKYYRKRNGLTNLPPSATLNHVNLQKLSEVVGSQVSYVKEERSEVGSVFTIETVNPHINNFHMKESGSEFGSYRSNSNYGSNNRVQNDIQISVDNRNHQMSAQQNTMPPLVQRSNQDSPLNQHFFNMQKRATNNSMSQQRPFNSDIPRTMQQGSYNNAMPQAMEQMPPLMQQRSYETSASMPPLVQQRPFDTSGSMQQGPISNQLSNLCNQEPYRLSIHTTNVPCSNRFSQINPFNSQAFDEQMEDI